MEVCCLTYAEKEMFLPGLGDDLSEFTGLIPPSREEDLVELPDKYFNEHTTLSILIKTGKQFHLSLYNCQTIHFSQKVPLLFDKRRVNKYSRYIDSLSKHQNHLFSSIRIEKKNKILLKRQNIWGHRHHKKRGEEKALHYHRKLSVVSPKTPHFPHIIALPAESISFRITAVAKSRAQLFEWPSIGGVVLLFSEKMDQLDERTEDTKANAIH